MNEKHIDDCARPKFTLDEPIPYQIKLAGQLSESMSDWMEEVELQIETDPSGLLTTTLSGIFDQAALLGLLRKFYYLGYPLISVNCIHSHNKNSSQEIENE